MPTSSTSRSHSTSVSLIERARRFDADAWRRLCITYGPLVYRWCRNKGLQAADAADIGQEVFKTVASRITAFQHDQNGATFRGWLWTITYNKLGDHFRRIAKQVDVVGGSTAHRQIQSVEHPDSVDSEHYPDSAADYDVLHRTLSLIRMEFEDTTWRAFWLVTVEGMPAEQVADNVGISNQAVRQAKYRVLRRLRMELKDDGAF